MAAHTDADLEDTLGVVESFLGSRRTALAALRTG
jgi:hypothetical protein